MKRCIGAFILAVLLSVGTAHARLADGRLGIIRYPISTRPEFVQPGGRLAMEVAVPQMASGSVLSTSLEIAGKSVSLDAKQVPGAGSGAIALEAAIPTDVAPGRYNLVIRDENTSDTSIRAVIVVDKFPDDYTIMHFTDIHVGRMADTTPMGEKNYEQMRDTANRIRPDLVIITGDLSDTSNPAEFKRFIEITEGIEAPTFAVPGNHDRDGDTAPWYLGATRYTFEFGKHFYLGFDTQYDFPDPDPSGQMKWIKSEVKSHASAPFKVLFSHRPDSDFHYVFSQVMLPYRVNILLVGHLHEDNTVVKMGALPSMVMHSLAELDGYYRIIHVKNDAVADTRILNVFR